MPLDGWVESTVHAPASLTPATEDVPTDGWIDRLRSVDLGSFSWVTIRRERMRLVDALLDIEVPVVGVAIGPTTNHAELCVLSDYAVLQYGSSPGKA
jgi:hypothetical protein